MMLSVRMWENQSEAGREGSINVRIWAHNIANAQEEANRVIS